ncbi:tropomyosin-like [Ctenocephalides felis]|uniref:tropomyosin-like n=1 Tax=Ctenocephalides felis TaxID=7515 RepID=UPI000E6E1C07|nr:tropomyosin-like [Ctenocephalides felis]
MEGRCPQMCAGQLIAALTPCANKHPPSASTGYDLQEKLSNMEREMKAMHKDLCSVKQRTEKGSSAAPAGGKNPCCSCGKKTPKEPTPDINELKAEIEKLKDTNRELCDELEDCRLQAQDTMDQMDEYRKKYLQAQQFVEELRRQVDILERDNMRISEQVNQELQRVKKMFQDKLQELSPLPFILETTQLKCQEALDEKAKLEKCMEQMRIEMGSCKERERCLMCELDSSRLTQKSLEEDNAALMANVKSIETKYNDLRNQMESELQGCADSMSRIKELEQQLSEAQRAVQQLNTVREECARQVQRLKDRHEVQKKMLQERVFSLEKDLALNRAAARSAINDRDEIRQRMQCQINVLSEHFEDAQQEIEALRGHVTVLKNSYTNILSQGNGPNDFLMCNCQRNL